MKRLFALEANHLSRWYGDVVGLNDVTADVEPGIVALVGPNGAGKTTLIRMAMGLIQPSKGSLKVLGEDPWNNPGLLSRIGFVSDQDAPWRELSGRECALRAARFSGLSEEKAHERVDAVIQRVGLQDARDKQVEAYSRGMRQRLKIALALIHEPELYILDEPLSGVDPQTRRDLIGLIRELAAAGKSLLVSTHVLPDIETMTNRIMLLNHGRLMAYGEVSKIRDLLDDHPRSIRIATPQPKELGAQLWGWPTVESIQTEESAVLVKTAKPLAFYQAIQAHLATTTIPFTAITSPDDNIESVFRYLVEG